MRSAAISIWSLIRLKKSFPELLQGVAAKAMMMNMKNILLTGFLLLAPVFVNIAGAVLYKGVDAQGNVVYSDQPFTAAEKFTPPPISVMDAAKAKLDKTKEPKEKPVAFKYISFDIILPKNNQTIRNESEVAVSLKIKPGLNTADNHSVWMLVNGKPVIKNTQNLSFTVGRLERGANELQAQIRDENGKVVARTRTTVVFVHQTSVY